MRALFITLGLISPLSAVTVIFSVYAIANAGESQSVEGYTFDPVTHRAEVDLDVFIAECAKQKVTITVSADRNDAQVSCAASNNNELPVFAGSEFAITWTR